MEQDRKHITSKDCWCNPEVIEVAPDGGESHAHRVASADEAIRPLPMEPETVEVNVVMGAQLRAIVRSALLHVRNTLDDGKLVGTGEIRERIRKTIDEELARWPLGGEAEPDTLAAWLYNRFGPRQTRRPEWERTDEEDQAYWEHEAAAVRRAVGRGGFKRTDPLADTARMPDGTVLSTPINKLHQADKDAHEAGGEVKSLRPLDLKNTQDMGEAIRIAVGAASTCWTNLMQAGVFKSTEALDIAMQLEHHVQARITEGMGLIAQRHDALGRRLRAYREAGHTTVSIQQAYQILTGTATAEEFGSALQVRPRGSGEKVYKNSRNEISDRFDPRG